MLSCSLQDGRVEGHVLIFTFKKTKTATCCLTEQLLELPKKDVLYIIGNWNAKVGNQEIPGVKGKFGLGISKDKIKQDKG